MTGAAGLEKFLVEDEGDRILINEITYSVNEYSVLPR